MSATTPRFSITLNTPTGKISFAVLGNSSTQYDSTGQHVFEHRDFENAMIWVLAQVHHVRLHMNGTIVDGYNPRFFENPWEWPNRS